LQNDEGETDYVMADGGSETRE